MNETLKKIWENLKKLPLWLRAVVLLLIAALALIATTSCGPSTKIVTRTDNKSSVDISITQPSTNDTDVNVDTKPEVNVQPTLTGYKYTISNI